MDGLPIEIGMKTPYKRPLYRGKNGYDLSIEGLPKKT